MSAGTIYQILGRLAFVLSSYGLHIALAYLITDMTDYGRLGVVFGMMSLARIFLTMGIPQSVSRDIAAHEDRAEGIFRAAIELQMLVGLLIFAVYMAGVPVWTRLFNDPQLEEMILVSGLVIPFTAVFQIMLAWLNGKRQFGRQSIILMVYSSLRVALGLGLFYIGLEVVGVIWGIVAATAFCMGIQFFWVPWPKKDSFIRRTAMLKSALPYVFSSFGVIVMLNCDLIVLKHFFPDSALVGYYAGAVNVGKLPFFVLLAYSRTLLPVVTKAMSQGNRREALRHIRKEMTSLVLLLVLGATLVVSMAPQILDFLYPSEFTVAAAPLRILFCASCGLTLVQAMLSLFGAAGRMALGAKIVLACIPLQIGVAYVLAPGLEGVGVALATCCAAAMAILALGYALLKMFGPFISARSVVWSLVAGVFTWSAAQLLPQTSVPLLPLRALACCALFGAFLYVLDSRWRALVHGLGCRFFRTAR